MPATIQSNPQRSKPNVLHITPVVPPFGGVAYQTKLLASSHLFRKMNFTILRSNPERKVEKPGAFYRVFSLWPFRMLKMVFCAQKQTRPDIVFIIANGDISFLRNVFLGYLAAKKSKASLVVHMHASRKGFWHHRMAGKEKNTELFKEICNSIGYRIVNSLLLKADAFSQLTSDIDHYYQSVGLRAATHIIPNAVILRKPNVSIRNPNKFLFVGRLSKQKGFFDLLEALSLLDYSNWSLDVLGSSVCSADENSIRRILAEHPYEGRIKLHGTIKGEAKWKFFDSSSFLVLPTHLEVFPNVILEAMASGLAVISTPIGEIESILPEQSRSLVQPGDTEALCSSIKAFLEDPDMVAEMGCINFEKVKEYSLDSVAKQFENMIIETLQDKGSKR